MEESGRFTNDDRKRRGTALLRGGRNAVVGSALVIGGLTLVFFGRALSGGQVFAMRDTAHFYYPLFYWCAEEWGAGRLPLWNPYEGIGSPVLADATSSVLYPGKLLFTFPLPFDWLFQFYIVAHFVLAAAGTWWLVREQKRSAAAATLAAIAFAFGGSVLFQYANVVFLVGAAWLPWAWMFLARLLRDAKWKDAAWLAVILALMTLGGDPQMVVHVALLAAIGWLAFSKPTPCGRSGLGISSNVKNGSSWLKHTNWKSALVIAAAFGFAGLLAAVQILPSVVYAKRTTRAQFAAPRSIYEIPAKPQYTAAGIFGVTPAGTHHEQVYEFSIGPWRWMELFVPNVAGRPFPRHQRWLNYLPAEGSLWTPSLYMGILPLLFALGQFRFRRGIAWTRWLTWSAVFFALGSIGWYGLGWLVREIGASVFGYDTSSWFIGHPVGGVYWLIVTFVPGYVQFRYPAKLWTIVALGIACLAARGFDAFLARKAPQQAWLWSRGCFVAIVCAAITPLVFAIAERFYPVPTADPFWGPFQYLYAVRDVGLGFVQVAMVCGLAWHCARRTRLKLSRTQTAFAAWSIVLLAGADLAVANCWQVSVASSFYWEVQTVFWGRSDPTLFHFWMTEFGVPRFYRANGEKWRPQSFAEISSEYRVMQILEWERGTNFGRFPLLKRDGTLRPMTSLVDAEYTKLLDEIDEGLADSYSTNQWDESQKQLGRLGGRYVLLPTNGGLEFRTVEVDDFRGGRVLPPDQTRHLYDKVLLEEGGQLELELTGNQATDIFINVAYDPGWRATAVTATERTNLHVARGERVMCALRIPAGTQRIEMRYDPPEFRWGAGISIAAWGFLLVAAFLSKLRRRST